MVEGKHEVARTGGFMSSGVYDVAKFCALILFPAFGAAYFSLAGIWGLPNAEEVVGTVTIVDTFLGAILGLSKRAYDHSEVAYDGAIDLKPDAENDVTNLNFRFDPTGIASKERVVLKVNKPDE